MAFYRKKPVVIEARLFDGTWKCALDILKWMEHYRPIDRSASRYFDSPDDGTKLLIPTLEGEMTASPGDQIIKGVHDEFYPCKPAVFEATYEPVRARHD